MDNSRERDLAILHKRFSNTTLPKFDRDLAYTSYQKILAQMKDRKLTDYRHQLIATMKTGHADDAEKLEQQIRDYERHQPWYRPPTK